MILTDLEAARKSREKNRRETDGYYDQQAQILRLWEATETKTPPKGLVMGCLPQGELRGIRRIF